MIAIFTLFHLLTVGLLAAVLLLKSWSLFKANQLKISLKMWTACTHASITLVMVSGIILIWQNFHLLAPWFFAKVVLFFVMISSLHKAFKKDDTVLLGQRKAGMAIALIAFILILIFSVQQPNFID